MANEYLFQKGEGDIVSTTVRGIVDMMDANSELTLAISVCASCKCIFYVCNFKYYSAYCFSLQLLEELKQGYICNIWYVTLLGVLQVANTVQGAMMGHALKME